MEGRRVERREMRSEESEALKGKGRSEGVKEDRCKGEDGTCTVNGAVKHVNVLSWSHSGR